ncbi:uncharacterized protein LOC113330876, partial [Papaver somniferum]|uniref:uncharacterized protein LOC113330876 n=1 Tax=Papaver somniferum TaxID=3469 RepID=UPI000E6FB6CC
MEDEGIYSGYKINRWAPSVSHIMFADDVMLFGNTDTKIINSITLVLQQYNHISGQLVNYSKSSIHFSKSVSNTYVEEIIQQLGVKIMQKEEKYLGVHIRQQGNKISNFNFLIDKFDTALAGRRKNNLSHAGRTVLIR